jgi:hypothetical protein
VSPIGRCDGNTARVRVMGCRREGYKGGSRAAVRPKGGAKEDTHDGGAD